jgi:hypothetical protein
VPVIFENPGIGGGDAVAGLLEPVEHLCCRADLVVVPAIGECRDLVQIGCMPLAYSAPPAPGWVMTDCRMWTNLIGALPRWGYSTGWVVILAAGLVSCSLITSSCCCSATSNARRFQPLPLPVLADLGLHLQGTGVDPHGVIACSSILE